MEEVKEDISTESIADALTASMNELSESDTETETEKPDGISEEAIEETEELAAAETEVEEDSEESEEPETVFQAPEHWSSDEREKLTLFPQRHKRSC